MKEYSNLYDINYFDCDEKGYVHLSNLLAYMAETSSRHSDSLGIGILDLRSSNLTWMINRWDIEVLRLPRANDKIKITTWAEAFDRFYAYREFRVYSKNGDLLLCAMSKWLYIDLDKMLPRKIPIEVAALYEAKLGKYNKDQPPLETRFKEEQSYNLNIRYTDIDNNGHVNNIKFIELILDSLPIKILTKKRIKSLSIVYKKELKYEDSAIVENLITESKSFHRIIKGKELCVVANIKWEENYD